MQCDRNLRRGAAETAGLRIASGVVGIALLAAIGAAIVGRGPWYDEFYTFYVTSPRFSFWTALRDHWLADNHPPLYYLLARLAAPLGDTVEARRTVNIVIGAVMLASGVALVRRVRGSGLDVARVSALFAIGLAAAFPIVPAGAELRSGFLSLAASALAVLALTLMATPEAPALSRRRQALLGIVLAVALYVHFVTSLVVLAIAGGFAARLILARKWQRFRQFATVTAAAAMPLLLTTALQAARLESNTRSFWIPSGFTAARWSIQRVMQEAVFANPVLLAAALAGFAAMAWDAARRRRLSRPLHLDPRLTLAVQLGLSIAAALVALMALHMLRPIVLRHYLIGLFPPIALALAVGADALMERIGRGWRLAVIVGTTLATLVAIHAGWRDALGRTSWTGTASAIAAQMRACPQTVVHADMAWNDAVLALPPADNASVVPFAYRTMARRHGLPIEPQGSRRLSATCPTIFWAEHVAGIDPAPGAIAARLRARGLPVTGGTLRRIGNGWLFVVPPRSVADGRQAGR